MVEHGYGGVSMEGIATRAGVGKAAIYRRWSNKPELVVDALREHGCAEMPLPDTGDLRADLATMLEAFQESITGPDGPVMSTFMAEKLRYPELREEFERTFIADRREHMLGLFRSAVERGDLPPDADVELFASAGPAIMVHRYLMHSEPPDPALPRRIVDLLLPPTAATAGREIGRASSRA